MSTEPEAHQTSKGRRFKHRLSAASQIALAIMLLVGVRLLRYLPLVVAVCMVLALVSTMLRQ